MRGKEAVMERPGSIRFLVLILAAGLAAALAASPAFAGHDLNRPCSDCHSLKAGEALPSSYSIWVESPTGAPQYQGPLRCDFCHTDKGANGAFGSAPASAHPVQVIVADNLVVQARGYVQGFTSTKLDCWDCHNGDNSNRYGLHPDLAATSYDNVQGNTPQDGYPDHDTIDPRDGIVSGFSLPGGWHLLSMLADNTGKRLINGQSTYNKVPSSAPATAYAFCLSCHDGSANTTRRKDIRQDYLDKGHYFKSTGGGITAGDRIPCSDCHGSHGSGENARLFDPDNTTFSGTRPTGLLYSNAASPTDNQVRAICTFCHNDTAFSGGGYVAGPYVRGVEPTVAPTSVSDHITYTGTKTYAKCTQCHNAHKTPAGGPACLNCHTAGGGGGGYEIIDNLFKGVGSDNTATRPSPSGSLSWSQHGGFDGANRPYFVYQSPFDTKASNDCV